jgi:hypothetical protein
MHFRHSRDMDARAGALRLVGAVLRKAAVFCLLYAAFVLSALVCPYVAPDIGLAELCDVPSSLRFIARMTRPSSWIHPPRPDELATVPLEKNATGLVCTYARDLALRPSASVRAVCTRDPDWRLYPDWCDYYSEGAVFWSGNPGPNSPTDAVRVYFPVYGTTWSSRNRAIQFPRVAPYDELKSAVASCFPSLVLRMILASTENTTDENTHAYIDALFNAETRLLWRAFPSDAVTTVLPAMFLDQVIRVAHNDPSGEIPYALTYEDLLARLMRFSVLSFLAPRAVTL